MLMKLTTGVKFSNEIHYLYLHKFPSKMCSTSSDVAFGLLAKRLQKLFFEFKITEN